MRKLVIGFCIATFFSFQGSVPTIKVVEKEENVEKLQRKGYSVMIQLEKAIVEKAWAKKVKEYGKVDASNGEYIVHEATMLTFSTNPVRMYSKVTEKAKVGTEVWMAVDMGTEFVTGKHAKKAELEKILYQFAVDAYRADFALQVEEAEKTLAKSTKEYEKTVANEQKVRARMQKNKEQKAAILEQLKQNKMDSVQLVKDLEMNKLEQKQDSLETVKLRKAVDVVKANMAKIQ